MIDLFFVGTTLCFFALSVVYVHAIEKLRGGGRG